MSRRGWLWLVAGLCLLALLPKARHWAQSQGLGLGLGPNRVAVLPLWGEIQDPGFTVRWLRRFGGEVRGVKAVVIALDTPGGGVAPSQEISQAIYKLRQDGMVVVASMGNMAASGGYYVASACDEIVANPGTVTGSIGVIMETVHLQDLLKKAGVHFEMVKSGEFKDAGNFSRPLRDRERALFQSAIDDVAAQFIEAVALGRREPLAEALARKIGGRPEDIDDAQVASYARKLSDGRIYTGRQALDLGLVDSLGGLEDAIDRAADLAGLKDPEVITLRERRNIAHWLTGMGREEWRSFWRGIFQANAPSLKLVLR